MIAAEDLCRILQREIGYVSDHVNGDMTGKSDFRRAFFALDVFDTHVVALGNILNDLFRNKCRRNRTRDHAGKHGACRIDGDFGTVDKAVSAELFDDAFKLTNVAFYVFTKEAEDFIGKVDVHELSLAFEDGNAELGIRRLDVDDKTAFETALDSFLEMLDILGRTVGGQNDLLTGVVKRVEGVEEFFLCGDLAGDELNIVDEEHIRVTIFFLEFGGGLFFDGANELVCKVFTLDKDDIEFGLLTLDLVCDRFHEVCFAKTG